MRSEKSLRFFSRGESGELGRRCSGCASGYRGSSWHLETECEVAIAKGELRAISVAVRWDGPGT